MWTPYLILCVSGMMNNHCMDSRREFVYGTEAYLSSYTCLLAANDWVVRLIRRPGWSGVVDWASCEPEVPRIGNACCRVHPNG